MSLAFHVRGAAVQVVRSTASPDTKRAEAESLGFFRRTGASVPERLTAKLDAAEKAQLAAYVAGLQEAETLRHKLVALTIAQAAADAAKYLAATTDKAEAETLLAGFKEAQATLRNAVRRFEKLSADGDVNKAA